MSRVAPVAPPWSDDDATGINSWGHPDRTSVLIDAVDELENTGSWSRQAWNGLGDSLNDEQRMELFIAVGWYRTICTLCLGAGEFRLRRAVFIVGDELTGDATFPDNRSNPADGGRSLVASQVSSLERLTDRDDVSYP